MELEGKTAFITGAASGIGRALALNFAKAGADVAIADIDMVRSEEVRRSIEEMGRRAIAVYCDVSHDSSVIEAVAVAIFAFGRIDILACNAGIGSHGFFEDHSVDDWQAVFNINLFGTIKCINAILPHFYKNGGGYVLITSSQSGLMLPTPEETANCLPYISSQFSVTGLAEGLRSYLKPKGVAVSLLCPGLVATNFFSNLRHAGDRGREMPVNVCSQAMQSPDEVAQIAVAAMKKEKFLILINPKHEALLLNRGKYLLNL
ncbi:MAG: SDR family NAD(P)-dependent oxidoreductase [Oscillospiraceae bacterium]|jgi:NAD(P)-dependent dehydrogenase (short-subunit alcohol dehydrogenase family)